MYQVELKPKAIKDIKKISKDEASKIILALLQLKKGLVGDIKKLTKHSHEYRLRVGSYRALFEIEGQKLIVYRIRHRRDIYQKS